MICELCWGPVNEDKYRLTVGWDTYHTCSDFCLDTLTAMKDRMEFDFVMKGIDPEPRPDEQRGWRIMRWWNQFYKHRRKAYEQWKVEMTYKRLQRRLKKEGLK